MTDSAKIIVTVTAIPIDPGHDDTDYVVECTLCGPLGAMDAQETQPTCLAHLRWHGVHTQSNGEPT